MRGSNKDVDRRLGGEGDTTGGSFLAKAKIQVNGSPSIVTLIEYVSSELVVGGGDTYRSCAYPGSCDEGFNE